MPLFLHIALGLWLGGMGLAGAYKLIDKLNRRKP